MSDQRASDASVTNRGPSESDGCPASAAWRSRGWIPADLTILAAVPLPPPSVGSACLLEGSIPEFCRQDPTTASVSFLLEGNPVVERRCGQSFHRQLINPGSFGVAPAGQAVEFRTVGRHKSLNLAIPDATIQAFAERELDHRGAPVELLATLESRVPHQIVSLGLAFARVIEAPRRGASLYAETLWTQIALQLLWHHSSLEAVGKGHAEAPLGDHRIAKVIAYLEENLGSDTSLSELAAIVDLSPAHFLRAFKAATGRTPHRYRTELRTARACEMLRDPSMSITEIAMILGYSSHSHFCAAFRRCRGTTPSAYRTGISGRLPDRD